MAKRLQSPSSINTFKQCQRKYYYSYIEKLPRKDSIHTVRGNIAHSTLEYFYDLDVSSYTMDNFEKEFKVSIQKLLLNQWASYSEKLEKLDLTPDKTRFYFEETMMMVLNWCNHFLKDMKKEYAKDPRSITDMFSQIAPVREQEVKSETHQVRGFIDAIKHHENGEIHIIDYKTNKQAVIKDSIRLQLSIYALLYQEKYGKLPQKVGAFFLREGLKMIDVTDDMTQNAKLQIENIHAHTDITDNIVDYKRTITPLCRWKTGQCDFYETCKPHG